MNKYRTKGYKGAIYPNGEFTIGYDVASYAAEKRDSREYERIHALQSHELRDEEGKVCMRLPLDVAQVYCPSEVQGQEERLALGLSTLRNSRKRGRYGLKGISGEAKRKIKSTAWLMEQRYGRRRLSFCTITIPPLSEGQRRWLHEHWNIFTNRIIEEIKRELKRNGSPTHVLAVTEIQSARFERYRELYLHLHLVWVGIGGRNRGYAVQAGWVRAKVSNCLKCILDEYEDVGGCGVGEDGINTNAAVDIQRVRKSVGAYLGKYLSKGSHIRGGGLSESDKESFPRQWWYSTRTLKRWLASCMQAMPHEEADAIVNESVYRELYIVYGIPIYKTYGDRQFLLGMVGKYKPGGRYHLTKTLVQELCNEE